MGNTFKTGNYVNGIFQDSSNNIGIGAAPSGTYKFEVTGTAKVSGILTLGSTISNGTYAYTLPSATGTLALTSDLSSYVPYTGATGSVTLGVYNLTANDIILNSNLAALTKDTVNSIGILRLTKGSNGYIQPTTLSVDRTYTLPNATGTIALTSDLSAYLPLAGGTLTGALTGTSASFSGASNPIVQITASATFPLFSLVNTPQTAQWNIELGRTVSGNLEFYNSGTKISFTPAGAATFSSNIAIAGQTLSAWGGTFGVIQSYYGSYFGGTSGGGTVMGNNNYFDGTNYKYVNTDYAGQIQIGSGNILLRVAASGTSGNNITYTNALTIASTGAATFSSSVTATEVISIQGTNQNYLRLSPSAGGAGFSLGRSLSNNNAQDFFIYDGIANATRFFINSSGDVGIGTSSPSFAGGGGLHINQSGTDTRLHLTNSTTGSAATDGFELALVGNDVYYDSKESAGTHLFYTAGSERMRIASGGEVLIGTTTGLGVNLVIGGTGSTMRVLPATDNVGYVGESTHRWVAIYAVNGAIQTSDRNEKTNIIPSELGLNYIMKLNPVSYSWKKDDGKKHYGLIAQEIEELEIEFGGLDVEDGRYGLNYSEFIAPLVKAIQEQQKQIEELKLKIK